jgi:hypothetical protein
MDANKFYTGNYAIYAKGIDRFLLIDKFDLNVTFLVAEILSSKLPVMVFILPASVDMQSPLNYSIKDKSSLKIGSSSFVVVKQTPVLRVITDTNNIEYSGVPEDYKNNLECLKEIEEYANFVKKYCHALLLAEKIYHFDSNYSFTKSVLPSDWLLDFKNPPDRSKSKDGIFFEIKQTLYISNSIYEAKNSIENIWINCSTDQYWLMEGFYKILNEPAPALLTNLVSGNISIYSV